MVTGTKARERLARRSIVGCVGVALLLAGCAVEPKPLTDAERRAEVQTDLSAMFAGQEPLDHPLSLPEAYRRAVKYNLDRRVKQMEEAVAVDGLSVANLDMLPKLTADAGYLNRSNTLAPFEHVDPHQHRSRWNPRPRPTATAPSPGSPSPGTSSISASATSRRARARTA